MELFIPISFLFVNTSYDIFHDIKQYSHMKDIYKKELPVTLR